MVIAAAASRRLPHRHRELLDASSPGAYDAWFDYKDMLGYRGSSSACPRLVSARARFLVGRTHSSCRCQRPHRSSRCRMRRNLTYVRRSTSGSRMVRLELICPHRREAPCGCLMVQIGAHRKSRQRLRENVRAPAPTSATHTLSRPGASSTLVHVLQRLR